MKKLIKLLIILFIPIILCSCEEPNNEGKLIEISAIELTRNFFGDNSKDFVFAIINEHKEGYKKFEEDLKKLVKETNRTIYYTYYQNIDTESALFIFNVYDAYFTSNAYHIVKDNDLILTELYTTYDKMKSDILENYVYEEIKYQSEKEIKDNLKNAKKEYEKGNISISFNYLNKIWDTKEAKEYYEQNQYLGLIKSWSHFTITDDKKPRITYRSLLFYHDSKVFYEALIKEYYESFEEPTSLDVYEPVYYYVKNDIIYTSDKENGTYKERFKIKEITKLKVHLFDYKYKKDFIYDRKV